MSFLHFAYAALLAALIALRLAGAGAPVSAADRGRSIDAPAEGSAVQRILSAEDAAPLMSGRSVALSVPTASDTADLGERRLHESIGAAGFARR